MKRRGEKKKRKEGKGPFTVSRTLIPSTQKFPLSYPKRKRGERSQEMERKRPKDKSPIVNTLTMRRGKREKRIMQEGMKKGRGDEACPLISVSRAGKRGGEGKRGGKSCQQESA